MPFAIRVLLAIFTLSPFILWASSADPTANFTLSKSTSIVHTSTPFTTYPPLSTSDTSFCTPNCSWDVPSMSHLTWLYVHPTATMTVATVQVIVNKNANTTRTTTKFDELPSGVTMTPIPTNAAGTRITSVTDLLGNVSTIAFPSGWADYDVTATWSGTLSTSSQCQTGTYAVTITTHPPYPYTEGLAYEIIPEDPRGIFYEPWIMGEPGSPYFFSSILADELFVHVCGIDQAAPPFAAQGTHFLTDTVTSFESGYVQTVAEPAANPTPVPEKTKGGGDGRVQAPEPSSGSLLPAPASAANPFVTHTAGLYSGILSKEGSIPSSIGSSHLGGSPSGGVEIPSGVGTLSGAKATETKRTDSLESSTDAPPSQFTGAARSNSASEWGWNWGFIVLGISMLPTF